MRAKPKEAIRVLVVDDSVASRELLARLLRADPGVGVVDTVDNGKAALERVRRHRPDVVVMDTEMPQMDGFETTREIMETVPVPIVMCSDARDPEGMSLAFHSLEAGAVSFVRKPAAGEGRGDEQAGARLVQSVKLMSEVKVVRRWRGRPRTRGEPLRNDNEQGVRLVGIGASTGGPPTLQSILGGLPKNFSAPILVVQHISPGFLSGMASWLEQTTGFRVVVAAHGIAPLPGHVYLAPDDFHLGIGSGAAIMLSRQPPENGLRPSVSFLFRSLAEECGPRAIGVLLSGMGKDGAAELRLMKDRGAVTIAQDRDTSVVHGMPGEAIARGGATYVLAADKIADILVSIVPNRRPTGEGEAGA